MQWYCPWCSHDRLIVRVGQYDEGTTHCECGCCGRKWRVDPTYKPGSLQGISTAGMLVSPAQMKEWSDFNNRANQERLDFGQSLFK